MNQPVKLPSATELDQLEWFRLAGGPEFDYHIDYAYAVLGVDREAGTVDVIFKWEPNAFCHYHRHLGRQQITIVQGEQHLIEQHAHETVHKVRRVGFTGLVPDGESHMEHGGPEGVVIHFHIETTDGRLFDLLDKAGNTLLTVSLEDIAARRLGVAA